MESLFVPFLLLTAPPNVAVPPLNRTHPAAQHAPAIMAALLEEDARWKEQ